MWININRAVCRIPKLDWRLRKTLHVGFEVMNGVRRVVQPQACYQRRLSSTLTVAMQNRAYVSVPTLASALRARQRQLTLERRECSTCSFREMSRDQQKTIRTSSAPFNTMTVPKDQATHSNYLDISTTHVYIPSLLIDNVHDTHSLVLGPF